MMRRIVLAAGFVLAISAPAALAQVATGPATPPPGPITNPFIHWRVLPPNPCPDDSVFLEIEWCSQCVHHVAPQRTGLLSARITHDPADTLGCAADSCPPSRALLAFGRFPAGPHEIAIELVTAIPATSGLDTIGTAHGTAPFYVRDSCEVGIGNPLPYLDGVFFAGAHSQVPCPGDSIRVKLFGRFPDDCHFVRRVDLLQPVCVTWPCLPIIRVLVDDGGCLMRPCANVVTPWSAELLLPPLPTGRYMQQVEMAVVTCSDSFPDGGVKSASFPFRVAGAAECGAGGNVCVAFRWAQGAQCDAEFDSSGRASLVMKEVSNAPLAGLQGSFRLSSDALRIEGIEPAGAAAGMLLTWNATPSGADWVLFSKGAPLPPGTPNDVLRVTVGTRPGSAPPASSLLFVTDGFGADSAGALVPACPEIATSVYPPPSAARLCVRRPCDANGDGRSDVRDLVLMVRCLHYSCPDSSRFDCDADGDFGIDDVLCCARRILHRDTHDTTGARPAPDVHVALDAPRETPTGWVLPVRLTGAEALGGARLEIAYPADRFTVSGLEQSPGAENWLSLWDTDSGTLVLGLLNLADPRILAPTTPGEVNLEVRLALRPGSQPGGSVAISAGEFSALDGAPLVAPIEPGAIPVVTPAKLALSSARPNPFSAETRFSLDLDRAAQVEVTVHDLGGRRIATLAHGSLPAGRHAMSWNGASDRGGRAPEGLYFVRCVADGRVVSQKVAILRQK